MNEKELKRQMLEGKNKILLFRRLEDAHEEDAARLVFQREHTFEYERDLDRIVTKDGVVVKVGELEANVDIDAIQSKKDPTYEMLQEAMIKGEKLELWEVNIDEDLKEDDKYPAVYCQGYLENWSPASSAEDEAEINSNFVVELEPQFGMATLTDEVESAVQYAFRDVTKLEEDEGNDGP